MNLKKLNLSVLLVTILVLVPTIQVVYASSLSTFSLSGGVYPSIPSYTIWRTGDSFYAKDAYGSQPSWSGSNDASLVINNADNAVPGGQILLKHAIYPLDSPIDKNPFNSLVGELKSAREYTSLRPSASFPSEDYLIRVETDSIVQISGSIENLNLYNPYSDTIKAGGILFNVTGWDGGSGGIIESAVVQNVYMQYVWRGLHLRGYVWHSYFDQLHIICSGVYGALSADAGIILEQSTPAHVDNVPKMNWLRRIVVKGGSASYPMLDAVRINEGNYNDLDIKVTGAISVSNTIFYICGYSNRIRYLGVDIISDAGILATLYIHGGDCNIITDSYVDATGIRNVKLDNGAEDNYIEYQPWGSIRVNATGAGSSNVINALTEANLEDLGGYDFMWYGTPETVIFKGYPFEDSGFATGESPIVVSHHLICPPNIVTLGVNSNTPTITASWQSNQTHITIYHSSGSSQTITWQAEYQPPDAYEAYPA